MRYRCAMSTRHIDAPYIDPRAIVDTKDVGARTKIWEFTHVLPGVKIGADCNLNSHVFVENGVRIGDRVTVKCGVFMWDGITIEDDVFVGPNVVFTNDSRPRSKRPVAHPRTLIRRGASLGAAAVIGPGVTVGEWAMVGMGAVVTKDVEPHALVLGSPARRVAWVCFCGETVARVAKSCRHPGRPPGAPKAR